MMRKGAVWLGAIFLTACTMADPEPPPAASANTPLPEVRLVELQPGAELATAPRRGYSATDDEIRNGKLLFAAFNCGGCHFDGGGGIGPPLMDAKWTYGSQPENIFSTIVEGRPQGMPSYGGKIPDAQVWQIVAYIKSLSSEP